ncbi:MAG: hypothetical protein ABS76_35250 [Pelagibacterium sp. SCN 64-44]|jgi:uncharacterized protein (UPF0303 family)|nr:MAG: hypothetical protein ABS76_35250 [Pelagibacterium sp. SCN 64-44]
MTPGLDALAAEQADMQLPRFDYEIAWRIGAHIRAAAAARDLPIAIEVSHGDAPVFFALMPGATPDNADWTRRKRAVALRFHRSSLAMRLECERHGWDFSRRFRLPEADYAASGGGVPIIVRQAGIVGAVAVSGLPDVEDHAMAIAALKSVQ